METLKVTDYMLKKLTIGILLAILVCVMIFLDSTDKDDPVIHVAVDMLWFLILFWIVLCGGLMYLLQNKFYGSYSKVKWPFWIKFTVFSIIFAMIEEYIAVSINNTLSPQTGGVAKLTASNNYWEVVSQHSIIALIPLFIIFGLLIPKLKLSQFQTFILFGLVGVFAEYTVSGNFAFIVFSLWIFVYGLIVYLPSRYLISNESNSY